MGRVRRAALFIVLAVSRAASAQPAPCGPEFFVPSVTTGSHGGAAVARAPDGGFLVAWAATSGPGDDADGSSIQARRYDANGVPVGSQWQVNSYTAGYQSRPRIAATPDGFLVVWTSEGGVDGDPYLAIEGQRLDAEGTPLGGEFQVHASSPVDQQGGDVATDAFGAAVVVWMSGDSAGTDTDGWSIQARRFDANGAPLAAEFQVNTYTALGQRAPVVARHAAGGFVVAWENGDYDLTIAARRYDAAGVPAGDEFQVSTAPTGSTYGPAVAADPRGGLVIAWSEQADVQAARFDEGGAPLAPPFQVNSFTPSIQYGPAMAFADDGSLAIVWTSWESAGTDVHFTNVQHRRLDATGTPAGADGQVNTATAGRQEAPAIASLGGQDFVVVWSGYDQNEPTFRSRVWGQRFASICVTTTTTSTSTTTLPSARLPGTTLRLASGKGADGGALGLRVTARDAGVRAGRGPGSADDPTLHGGFVRLRAGGWSLDATTALPAAGWRRTRRGWRYAGDAGTVAVKDGASLRAKVRIPGVAAVTDPTPIDVLVRVGEQQLCLAFQPGTAVRKRRTVVARDGAPPAACLAP